MADRRQLPHNLEAEESLLGAMMLSKDAIQTATALIRNRAEMFYKPAHGHIYDAIAAMASAGEKVDPITVAEHLTRRGLLDSAGGPGVLVALQASAPAVANVGRYAEIVAELWALRKLITTAGEIAEMGYSLPDDVDAAVAAAAGMVQAIQRERGGGGMMLLSEALGITLDEIERRYEDETSGTIDTGLDQLDRILGGIQPGSLVVAAARSGVGKTAFALCVAAHVALVLGQPVLVHTLEMSVIEIVKRLMASELRVDSRALRSGKVSERDWERISDGIGKLAEAPLWIDDDNEATVASIRANVMEIYQLMGVPPALVIVDYVQLMEGDSSSGRQQELANISRQLKVLAGKPIAGTDAKTVVMALSQLKRDVDERQDKRPMLKDLRETGALEMDADLVLGIYREDTYKRNTDRAGIAEVIVLKARSGPTGAADCAYVSQYTKFANFGNVVGAWTGDTGGTNDEP